jgi:hypothetical protein
LKEYTVYNEKGSVFNFYIFTGHTFKKNYLKKTPLKNGIKPLT